MSLPKNKIKETVMEEIWGKIFIRHIENKWQRQKCDRLYQ